MFEVTTTQHVGVIFGAHITTPITRETCKDILRFAGIYILIGYTFSSTQQTEYNIGNCLLCSIFTATNKANKEILNYRGQVQPLLNQQ